MAIAANPDKTGKNKTATEAAENRFIGAATAQTTNGLEVESDLMAVNMRLQRGMVKRAELAAKRLGISKTGFFAQAAVEKLEALGM